jgi:urease accessory protein UreE
MNKCTKTTYPTLHIARAEAKRLNWKNKQDKKRSKKLSAYKCHRCKKFHLTSQKVQQEAAIVRRLVEAGEEGVELMMPTNMRHLSNGDVVVLGNGTVYMVDSIFYYLNEDDTKVERIDYVVDQIKQ